MSIIFCGLLEQSKNTLNIHTFELTLGYVGGVIFPILFTRFIVHPGIIH
jgi:hypothetical protein